MQEKTDSKIRPCPFCGYPMPRPTESEDVPGTWSIWCPKCGARTDDCYISAEEARAAWNHRQELEDVKEKLRELQVYCLGGKQLV